MTAVRVLDSEMVHALGDPGSKKHRRAISFVEADRGPRRRRRPASQWLVPSTVRVEACWDRTASSAALINHLGIADHHLDGASANVAARLRRDHGVAPADAHVGAVLAPRAGDEVVVFTSDPEDIALVAGTSGARIIVV